MTYDDNGRCGPIRAGHIHKVYHLSAPLTFGTKLAAMARCGWLLFLSLSLVLVLGDKEDKKDYGTVVGIDLGTTYSW